MLVLIITRLPVIMDGVIPFAFDHGKDSLAVLDMWLNHKPKFVGPWTSIPGLYFGPGWYYLLLPFYVLSGGQPVSGVVAMLLLHLVFIILAYKHFGKLAATIFTCSPIWFTITQSAWNPFPMALLSLLILILLKKLESAAKQKNLFFWLGLVSGFGFHFSTAYAIFYPIIIFGSLIFKKTKLKLKQTGAFCLGFMIPFVPQFLFELKNNFVQTKGIWAFLTKKGEAGFSLSKLATTFKLILAELRLSFLAEFWFNDELVRKQITLALVLLLGVLALSGIILFWQKSNKQAQLKFTQEFLTDVLLWLLFPSFGFVFLHFNVWDLLPMAPLVVVLLTKLLNQHSPLIKHGLMAVYLLAALSKVNYYYHQDKLAIANQADFLPIKLRALQAIREKAQNQSFASYHYVSDIYDFSYQYLYFYQALQGEKLPYQFAYQPQDTFNYVVQKPQLLTHFREQDLQYTTKPALIFYLIEQPANEEFLQEWWDKQQYSQIIERQELSPELVLLIAKP